MPQNSVNSAPDLAYAGQLIPGALREAQSARTEGTGLTHGSPCKRGTKPETQVKAFAAADPVNAQTFAGIVIGSFSRSYEDFSSGLIADSSVSVLTDGKIAMNFAEAVTAGEQVVIKLSDGTLYGYAQGDALPAGYEALPGCRIVQTTTTATLATVRVRPAVGDLSGGLRRSVGPFTAPGALGVTAPSQTNLALRHSHTVTAYASGFVAPRAGSITGLSASLSAAMTGGGSSMSVKVTKNGVAVASGLDLTFTTAGAATTAFSAQAPDVTAFAAGDVLGVVYTSDAALSNTPALVADLEIEC